MADTTHHPIGVIDEAALRALEAAAKDHGYLDTPQGRLWLPSGLQRAWRTIQGELAQANRAQEASMCAMKQAHDIAAIERAGDAFTRATLTLREAEVRESFLTQLLLGKQP